MENLHRNVVFSEGFLEDGNGNFLGVGLPGSRFPRHETSTLPKPTEVQEERAQSSEEEVQVNPRSYGAFLDYCDKHHLTAGSINYSLIPQEREALVFHSRVGERNGHFPDRRTPAWQLHRLFNEHYRAAQKSVNGR